jgi:NH3-dependent NAD+ synthetase
VPIDKLYVPPRFRTAGDTVASYAELVAAIDRTVVLGVPGGGKSTLAKKLCFDAAKWRGHRRWRPPDYFGARRAAALRRG